LRSGFLVLVTRSAGAPAAPALAPRVRRVLVIVIWNFAIEQLAPDQSFFIRSDGTLAGSGPADT